MWTGSLELAELKQDRICFIGSDFRAQKREVDFPLGVTIDPLPD